MSDILKTHNAVASDVLAHGHPSGIPASRDLRSQFRELSPKQQRYFRWKYRFDRLLGLILLIPLSPLIALLYLLVRCSSPGPGLYCQERLGEGGRPFTMIKLRSMCDGAENGTGPMWASQNDQRVTPVGRWLRKLHLDELTQLWNVVRGEMSLVGPRPERPEICQKLEPLIDCYYDRLCVRPGVTGLAQINLPPDQTNDDAIRKQILDLNYIETAGPWLDARMLMATALRLLGIRGEVVMRMMFLCRLHLVQDVPSAASDQPSEVRLAPREVTQWKASKLNSDQELLIHGASKMNAKHDPLPTKPR